MPPKTRTTKAEPAAEKPSRGEPCTREECFPAGHPEDAHSVGCQHGTWVLSR